MSCKNTLGFEILASHRPAVLDVSAQLDAALDVVFLSSRRSFSLQGIRCFDFSAASLAPVGTMVTLVPPARRLFLPPLHPVD